MATKPAEHTDAPGACRVVREGHVFQGKQALTYAPGISAETAGAQRINLQKVIIPPQGRSKAHLHAHHETAAFVLQGEAVMWCGEGLREEMTVRAGDYLYIPAGMPHVVYNPSETEPAVAIIARTDPNEQESVVLLPELEGLQ